MKEKAKKKNVKKCKKKTKNKKINYKRRRKIALFLAILIILTIIIILLLTLDIFNIKTITVINNDKVTTENIIQSSGLKINTNQFKSFNIKIKNNIMQSNPYIENVEITRKLNGEVIIDVEERTPTFMLQLEGNYAYINNQGYILEITNIPLNLPVIVGYSTTDMVEGNRLIVEDLQILEYIIQILEVAKSNGINDIITTIDISDNTNYILYIPSESKTVEFGNNSNINTKILWIIELIEKEKGIEGTICLNVPNIEKVYFREKV